MPTVTELASFALILSIGIAMSLSWTQSFRRSREKVGYWGTVLSGSLFLSVFLTGMAAMGLTVVAFVAGLFV